MKRSKARRLKAGKFFTTANKTKKINLGVKPPRGGFRF